MKKKPSHYPAFFSRLPVCTDRDVLALECQLRGARQDVWVQLEVFLGCCLAYHLLQISVSYLIPVPSRISVEFNRK